MDSELHRRICAERSGRGGASVCDFGLSLHPASDAPEGVQHTITWFGPNERDEEVALFWQAAEEVVLAPDAQLHTAQPYVSPTAITQLDAPVTDGVIDWAEERPQLVRVAGRLWMVDGHHRIVQARQLARPIRALVADYEQALADEWFDALLDPDW